jgi:hypothetical protein
MEEMFCKDKDLRLFVAASMTKKKKFDIHCQFSKLFSSSLVLNKLYYCSS